MKKSALSTGFQVVLPVFILSRIIVAMFGIHMDYSALYRYWQYLDGQTLTSHLLRGIWYDHTQPPVFNLLLGIVLKTFGTASSWAFSLLFKVLSLLNAFLLLAILRRILDHPRLPLLFTLLYILSPACIIFENELFYTNLITCFLLTSAWFLLRLAALPSPAANKPSSSASPATSPISAAISWKYAVGFFVPLVLVCLTRSMYHLVWLLVLSALLITYFRRRPGIRALSAVAALSVLLVGSWYLKNALLFRSFSTSTWMGMNMARNVFHDAGTPDSSHIEAIEPFSPISAYHRFLPPAASHYLTPEAEKRFGGLDDRDLLSETKNDSFTNEKHLGYIAVSQAYMDASKQQIKAHPTAYLKNVLQSAIIFFAPATRYPTTEYQAQKIAGYDVLYSFNLSHFAQGKQQRRIALTLSALPKLLIYLIVFGWTIRQILQALKPANRLDGPSPGNLAASSSTVNPAFASPVLLLNIFIVCVIGYIFCISSFFEHYENMRFRYEAEPLFLILAAQAAAAFLARRKARLG